MYDCSQFASRYVHLMTGVDHAATYVYDSEIAATRILVAGGGIEALTEKALGASRPVAEPGDVVLCRIEEGLALGVTNGHFVWGFVHDKGLARMPMESIVCAWSVA